MDECWRVSAIARLSDTAATRSRIGRESWNWFRETQSLLCRDIVFDPSSEIVKPIICSESLSSVASSGAGSSMIKRARRRATADGRAGMGYNKWEDQWFYHRGQHHSSLEK